MSDTLRFYVNTSRQNTLAPSLAPITGPHFEKSVIFKGPYDVDHPTVILDYDDIIMGQANYCSFVESGYSYFFDGHPVLISGGRMEISLSIDYLASYKEEIRQSEIFVERNEMYFNRYYSDNEQPVDVRDNRALYLFPNAPFNNPNFILITAGGEGTI